MPGHDVGAVGEDDVAIDAAGQRYVVSNVPVRRVHGQAIDVHANGLSSGLQVCLHTDIGAQLGLGGLGGAEGVRAKEQESVALDPGGDSLGYQVVPR